MPMSLEVPDFTDGIRYLPHGCHNWMQSGWAFAHGMDLLNAGRESWILAKDDEVEPPSFAGENSEVVLPVGSTLRSPHSRSRTPKLPLMWGDVIAVLSSCGGGGRKGVALCPAPEWEPRLSSCSPGGFRLLGAWVFSPVKEAGRAGPCRAHTAVVRMSSRPRGRQAL